jgi:hypothetical protein
MVKNMEMIQKADALTPEPLLLSDEKSLWGSDIYIAVTKEVPGAEMVRISGTYLTKVFEGHYPKRLRRCTFSIPPARTVPSSTARITLLSWRRFELIYVFDKYERREAQ